MQVARKKLMAFIYSSLCGNHKCLFRVRRSKQNKIVSPETTFHYSKCYFPNCIDNAISKFLHFQCHPAWISFPEISLIIHEKPFTLNLSKETFFENCPQ